MSALSDEELMARWQVGEESAFDELFCRLAPRLQAWFRRAGHPEGVAQDLVQQTFLQLYRSRSDYRPDQPLRPWLLTIALNESRQVHRRYRRKPEDRWPTAEPAAPRGVGPTQPEERAVRRALQELNPAQREILLLHWYEGLSFAEIAAVIGGTVGAAKVRASRAYTQLRALLGEG